MGYFSTLDLAVTHALQSWQGAWLLPLARFVSWFGSPWAAIAMVVLVSLTFYFYNYRREAIFILVTLLAAPLNYFLKLIINRPRPNKSLVTIYDSFFHPSFPSGHVTFYVVFFGFLIYLTFKNKNWPKFLHLILFSISWALIILISFSRIYLGAHWFTDALGGYLFGVIILSVLVYFYKRSL